MGFLKNYVANMGQIAKKLGKSSIYEAALKLCSLLVTLLKDIDQLEVISKKWVIQVKSKGDDYLKMNMDSSFKEIIAVIQG